MKPTMSANLLPVFAPLLLFAATAGLALALAGPGSVSAQEGAMAVDCEGITPQVEVECEFGEEQMFTVAVHATSAPVARYVAFQAKLRWDDAVLDYRPSAEPDQEAAWPDCDIPARRDNRPGDASVLFGCVSFPLVQSSYTGPLLQFTFACVSAGTSQLTLVPREGDVQDGSHFIELDPVGEQMLIDPSLTGASVTCGGQAVDPPTPEPTLQPPGPTAPPDSSTEATATPEVTGPPATGTAGGAGGEGRVGFAGWVLVVLAILGGGSAVGILAWRRLARR